MKYMTSTHWVFNLSKEKDGINDNQQDSSVVLLPILTKYNIFYVRQEHRFFAKLGAIRIATRIWLFNNL